eukprot:scaffold149_cov315-Pinguiococcus_pyrenoidosus.AAC.64
MLQASCRLRPCDTAPYEAEEAQHGEGTDAADDALRDGIAGGEDSIGPWGCGDIAKRIRKKGIHHPPDGRSTTHGLVSIPHSWKCVWPLRGLLKPQVEQSLVKILSDGTDLGEGRVPRFHRRISRSRLRVPRLALEAYFLTSLSCLVGRLRCREAEAAGAEHFDCFAQSDRQSDGRCGGEHDSQAEVASQHSHADSPAAPREGSIHDAKDGWRHIYRNVFLGVVDEHREKPPRREDRTLGINAAPALERENDLLADVRQEEDCQAGRTVDGGCQSNDAAADHGDEHERFQQLLGPRG